jgi:hypothetical protein
VLVALDVFEPKALDILLGCPSPTASAMLLVPASKRVGGPWYAVFSNVTSAIMLPPSATGRWIQTFARRDW